MAGNQFSAWVFDTTGRYLPAWRIYTAVMVAAVVPAWWLYRRGLPVHRGGPA